MLPFLFSYIYIYIYNGKLNWPSQSYILLVFFFFFFIWRYFLLVYDEILKYNYYYFLILIPALDPCKSQLLFTHRVNIGALFASLLCRHVPQPCQ
jgi:hypothetical protein